VEKVREYSQKAKGKLFVDASPQIEQEYKDELSKAQRQYGAENADMNSFPDFKFQEPVIDPIETPKA